jgi:ADP-ribose pyrophosphatase
MIPKQAKKVFNGVIFDVYQWDQEMYDGTTETFEKLRRPGTVEVLVVTQDNKIMIQKQSQPDKDETFLCPVGGRVDPGEEPLATAKREMLEETGYSATDWSLLHEVSPMSKIDWKMHVYVARDIEKVADQHLDAGEKIELLELDFDAFIRLVDQNKMRRMEQDLRMMCVRAVYDSRAYKELQEKILGG